jgi:prevent-host-death family protein
MGRQVGVLEAKTHLSNLITEIETSGEMVTITRHGKPVVHIVAATPRRVAGPETIQRMRAIREAAERRGAPTLDVQTLIREIRDGDD